jgi:hypothetical protein
VEPSTTRQAATQEFPNILLNLQVQYRSLSWGRSVQYIPATFRSILILSMRLQTGPPIGSFLMVLPQIFPHSSYIPCQSNLIPPRSKHSPQHPVLKHPQFMFILYCQRPCFTPISILLLLLLLLIIIIIIILV